jgi:hypothetical protein
MNTMQTHVPLWQRARPLVPEELANVPWMSSLSRAEQEHAAQSMRVATAQAGDTLCRIGKPPTYYREMADAFTAERYHKVRDTLQPDYDFSGAIEDLRLLFTLGNEVAETNVYPSWKPGSEFHR